MKYHYEDILRLTKRKPVWYDENGAPRFCDPAPDKISNIYARECCFFKIRCQACGTEFLVGVSYYDIFRGSNLYQDVKDHKLHYGDPPNAGCCATGPTMSSESQEVVTFWTKDNLEWREVTELRGEKLE